MVITMSIIIPAMALFNYPIEDFKAHTQLLNFLLEPAIVVLGYPLYQQINVIKKNFRNIFFNLAGAITVIFIISHIASMLVINNTDITTAITLKSITTSIGLELTEQLGGVSSLTAMTITIAGLTGAIFGQSWLNLLKITNPQAQGLAVGCAAHALGTSAISRVSVEHSAFSSLALALSALITAIIAPILLPLLNGLFVT